MRWSNVFLIFRREVRDQARDRRTLFMIFLLPMLLYPILGIGMIQFSAAFAQKPRNVVVVGDQYLPDKPPLLNEAKTNFEGSLFDHPDDAERMLVTLKKAEGHWTDPVFRKKVVRDGLADAIVTIPADLEAQLKQTASASFSIDYDSADETSQVTQLRLKEVLSRWKELIVSARLQRDAKPSGYIEPITIVPEDAATRAEVGGSVWARLFPFLLVMMSLTGAFYPAIDLCAGEKERGTMETLLISPASRSEIVFGKFLTVVLASMLTALLNLVSMGVTGLQLATQLGQASAANPGKMAAIITPPTFTAACWMLLLLIPLSIFFSALCLALAVMAKSMKEGQYYMTPLYLVCIPLIFLTLMPGIELNLFYSLVPISGACLLLRALILGDYGTAFKYFLPVLIPTILYGILALRWAISQFEREDVLFREAERFDLASYVRHLIRDKQPLPTPAQSLLCFAIMLCSAWFIMQFLGTTTSSMVMAVGQVAFILIPPVVMALLLTSSPRRTLRLYWPDWRYLAIGAGLALSLHPLISELRVVVEELFPVSDAVKKALAQMMGKMPDVGTAILLFAFVPAICEEFAFRGFILAGLENGNGKREAVLGSSVLFGFMHVLLSLFQQLWNATLLGIVIGVMAVRSGSILPGIVFHFVNNGLAVFLGLWTEQAKGRAIIGWLYRSPDHGLYHYSIVAVSACFSVALFVLMLRIKIRAKSLEPALSESRSGELVDLTASS
ncbi:ABC transporter permease subunit/CPBP intramembrane protease [Singulisphaera sp. PoT]|uniref:ABC transporter permease subunit/CPBP intramembrane protease n=1 Tax=Singulisphaera sp. PoT TaxID=3411797 RepID=UPI003BF53870